VDVVKHGETGLLVKEKDVSGIADAVVKILSNEEDAKRLASNGWKFVREHFSHESIVRLLRELYVSLTSPTN
jgi:glycosyltransferase involved in cell wall biosynthesis